jgi:hypothetical protein
MTLNITLATPSFVAQASDRRMTRRGQPSSDEANKAVVIKAVDGDITVTFAGLGVLDRMPVDDWLLERLSQDKSPTRGIEACVQSIRESATAAFLGMQHGRTMELHTFVVAGWSLYWKANAKIWVVSNCENENLEMTEEPYDEFVVREVRPTRHCVLITGMEPAVDPRALDRLVMGTREGVPIEQVLDAMVSEIRLAARHPDHGKYIGETCMTVAMRPDGQTMAVYYPAHGYPVRYAPNVIFTYPAQGGETGMAMMRGVLCSGGGPDFVFGGWQRGGVLVRDRRWPP